MLTDRGKGLLLTAAVAWGVSRAFGVPEVGMAAVASLALTVLAVVYTLLASARLSTHRAVHPPRLFHDAEATVELRVTNTGRLRTAILQLEDEAPTALADDHRFVVAPVAAGDTVTLRYSLHGRHRGRYRIGPLVVRLRDPFGIAARAQQFSATDEVIVYPPVWRLPAGVPLGGTPGSGADGRPRPVGRGDELAMVREYVRGDDLRRVHWRSTAHRGKLMVRQNESRSVPQATVVLDTRAAAHRGAGPGASFETGVTAAASVTYHVAELGFATRLITDPLGRAPRPLPWELLLEQLATVRPDRHTDLDALWTRLAQGGGGDGLLISITTVPSAAELRRMVRAGRSFDTRLAVIVDAETHTGRRRVAAAAAQAAEALAAAGWRCTVVAAGDRLDERWRQLALPGRPVGVGGGR